MKCVENEVSRKFHVFKYYTRTTKNHKKRSTPSYSQENILSFHVHGGWQSSVLADLSTWRTTSRSVSALARRSAERNEARPSAQDKVRNIFNTSKNEGEGEGRVIPRNSNDRD